MLKIKRRFRYKRLLLELDLCEGETADNTNSALNVPINCNQSEKPRLVCSR